MTSANPPTKTVNYVSEGSGGHRSDYDRVLNAEMQSHNIQLLRVDHSCEVTDQTLPVLFSMLDSDVLGFLIVAVRRSAYRRVTVGLFFRPGECFLATSVRYRVKRLLFRLASKLPRVHILTLMPFAVSPQFSEVANGWIYDPQLWDLGPRPAISTAKLDLDSTLNGLSSDKPIIVALGKQEQSKGFDFLADLWSSSSNLRGKFDCIVAGKVHPRSDPAARTFVNHGGILINRLISDEELLFLYGKAAVVWCCYSPHYNQASGIFGRAYQMGVPVVVRKHSYLARFGELLQHPTLAIPFSDASEATRALLEWQPMAVNLVERAERVRELRSVSTSTLIHSLYSA